MNRTEWLSDELLADAFEYRATRGSLEGVRAEILRMTADVRQHRTWLSRVSDAFPATMPRRAVLVLVLLAALLGVVLALALAGRQPPGPFNVGTLAFVRDGDVYLADADGSNARVALHQNGILFSTVSWSRDGSELAVDGETGVVLLDIGSGAATLVGGHSPTWSPEGKELAVIFRSDLQPTVLRLIDAGSHVVRAEFPFVAESGLAWSPNGRWIAATGDCTGPLCPVGVTSAANSVIRIDVRTGEVLQIDARSGHLDAARQVTWSPDSEHVAYIRYGVSTEAGCGDTLSCSWDVFIADADGSNDIRLQDRGRSDQPAWSPDGQWIAFRDGNHLAIEHSDGTAGRVIVDRKVLGFSWAPGSDRLWFTQDGPGGKAAVWESSLAGATRSLGFSVDHGSTVFGGIGLDFAFQVLAPGQAPRSLPNSVPTSPAPPLDFVTPAPAGPADPSEVWRSVLTESRDLCELLSIPTDTGAATKIADVCSPPPTDGSSGSWSPTGAAYAIVRNGRLSVIDPDGRVDMDIDGLTGLGGVAWSPGGIWLGATGTSAYVLRPDGSGLRQLSGNVLSWSPDGQKLAVSGTDGMLLVGPASGVGVRSIGVFPWPSTWSSDGSRFAFLRDGDLWTAAIDGTDVRNITSLPLGGAIAAAWSPDDRWIAVATNHGLLLTHPDGAEARWLELDTDETVWGPRWSPDSTRVAFSTYPEGSASQRAWRTYLVAASGAPTILLEATWDVSWSPDGRFLVGTDSPSSSSGSGQGLVLMNSDGSGRRVLRPEGFGNTPVWVR